MGGALAGRVVNTMSGAIGVAVLAAFLGVIYIQLPSPISHPIVPGQLMLARTLVVAQSYLLQGFVVQWRSSQLSVRRIYNKIDHLKDADPPLVLATVAGEEFVFGATTQWQEGHSNGHTTVEEKSTKTCSGQHIEQISQSSNLGPLRVIGTLTACPGLPQFVLQLATAPGGQEDHEHLSVQVALCLRGTLREPRFGQEDIQCKPPSEAHVQRVFLSMASMAEEHFFGLGAQFSAVDLRGLRVPVFTNEQPLSSLLAARFRSRAVAGQWHSTYTAVPQVLTSGGRGWLLRNPHYAVFDLRSTRRVVLELNATHMLARAFTAPSPLELVEELTRYTGRFRPIPDWVAEGGAIVGLQGGSHIVRKKVKAMREAGVPVVGVWLQVLNVKVVGDGTSVVMDWVGKRHVGGLSRLWWNWEVDRGSYADWEDLVLELYQDGIYTLGYINPHFADVEKKANTTRNMYREALESGFLVKMCDGSLAELGSFGFSAGLLDLTNPSARGWMKDIIKSMLKLGIRGWMADFAEALPLDACMYDNSTGATWHNAYPAAWAELNKQAIYEADMQKDAWIFTRAAGLMSPHFTNMQWLGDQLTSWDKFDGIGSVLAGSLSGGFSGLSLTHSDIGGYTSIALGPVAYISRTTELFMRWCEMSAFTPVYRSHEGCQPDVNVQHDSSVVTMRHFALFAQVHKAWSRYRKTLLTEAYQRGFPMMRHMYMQFPLDPQTPSIDSQYMLGADVLVAPVVTQQTQSVKVYLPEGNWTRMRFHFLVPGVTEPPSMFFSQGKWYTVYAPIGFPAVFFRMDSEHGRRFQDNVLRMLLAM